MKKLLPKIALSILSSIILLPLFYGAIVSAAPTAEQIGALAKPYEDNLEPCVKELIQDSADKTKFNDGPDANYIITVIEEPLTIEPSGNTDNKDPYVVRRCFRNTFQYIKPKTSDGESAKSVTLPFFAKTCSEKAQGPANDPAYKDWNVQFSCKEVQVILTKGGTTAIYGYIRMIYRWGASIVGIIAVTVIILSGIQISAAGGDPEAIGKAKKRIMQSIAGIVVLFLSGLILYTINPTFFTLTK